MVHTTFNSEYHFGKRNSRQVELLCKREQCQARLGIAECSQQCKELSSNLYQVVINGEDGEYIEDEIEAESHSEASAKAEALAADNATNSIKFKYKYSSHHFPFTIDYGNNIFDDPFHRTFD